MRLRLLWVLSCLLVPGLSHAADPEPGFKLIHVAELAKLQQEPGSRLAVFDANDAEFRAANGVIPGAKLLSSFNHYDVARELPQDKSTPLVFYCANSL